MVPRNWHAGLRALSLAGGRYFRRDGSNTRRSYSSSGDSPVVLQGAGLVAARSVRKCTLTGPAVRLDGGDCLRLGFLSFREGGLFARCHRGIGSFGLVLFSRHGRLRAGVLHLGPVIL